jgi:hypothetical protein
MLFRFLFCDDIPSFVKFCDDNLCDIIKPLLYIILRDFLCFSCVSFAYL